MKKTCPYCGTIVLKEMKVKRYYCEFCDMYLNLTELCDNGNRKVNVIKESFAELHFNKSTPEIMLLSTYELLQLLKESRKMRSENYEQLQTVKRLLKTAAKKGDDISDCLGIVEESAKLYEYTTRKMFVFENLICDRLGYIPKRITQKFILDYAEQMQENKDSNMLIQKVTFKI